MRLICRMVLGCALFSSAALGQQASSTDARSIILACLTSLGATSGVIQGTTAQGAITLNGQSGTIVLKTMGQSVRYEVTLPDEQFVTVFANGSAVRTQDGTQNPIPPWSAAYYRPWHMPLLSRMADIVSSDIQYQSLGTELVSGRPAWHIQIWSTPTDGSSGDLTKEISEFHVFVDQATARPVKFLTYDYSPDAMENRTAVETYFSDYRVVSGALIPFHITRYVSGSMEADLVLSSATTNVSQSAADFR